MMQRSAELVLLVAGGLAGVIRHDARRSPFKVFSGKRVALGLGGVRHYLNYEKQSGVNGL